MMGALLITCLVLQLCTLVYVVYLPHLVAARVIRMMFGEADKAQPQVEAEVSREHAEPTKQDSPPLGPVDLPVPSPTGFPVKGVDYPDFSPERARRLRPDPSPGLPVGSARGRLHRTP